MFDFGLSIIKNMSSFGVIYTKLMLKLESDEKNYVRYNAETKLINIMMMP